MNSDCEHLVQRDEIWYGRERHDLYCLFNNEWCPDCRVCKLKRDEEDE